MMNSYQIDQIVRKFALSIQHNFNEFDLKESYSEKKDYAINEIFHFLDDLGDKARRINLNILQNNIPHQDFEVFVEQAEFPILVFLKKDEQNLEPLLIKKDKKGKSVLFDFHTRQEVEWSKANVNIQNLAVYENNPHEELNGQIVIITCFPMEYLEDDYYNKGKIPTPFQRVLRLLRSERKDIAYIYVYSIVIGLLSLSLPLGIQAIITLISAGSLVSSTIVLMVLIIVGVMITGGLQIMQMTVVEILQQRVFAKTAFEFIYRLPRMKPEKLQKYYPPELMNRFFDILTIQKGLPKLLIDILGAVIQILAGLLLLAFYHPSFLAFSIITIGVLIATFYLAGPKGLEASMMESKYKYKIAHWLEEVARTVNSFRLASNSNLPIQKMDNYVNNYLYYRKKHFKVLIGHYLSITVFKIAVTAGLLIVGTLLVVDGQITLGQFVASEVVIILVVGSVEKLVVSMDIIYDLMTSAEKIGNVTDIPLNKEHGIKVDLSKLDGGLSVHLKDLSVRYGEKYLLRNINLDIQPGDRVCITGADGAGKSSLIKMILGSFDEFDGVATISNCSLRDINVYSYQAVTEDNFSEDEIFAGTILDNISMGKGKVSYQDIVWALDKVGLLEQVNALPDGLHTELTAGGRDLLSSVQRRKLVLARCIAAKPKLLIINDFLKDFSVKEKQQIMSFLLDSNNNWTLILVSNDITFLANSPKIVLMKDRSILQTGTYEELISNDEFREIISQQNAVLDILRNVAPKRTER
jgi:ABC-type bacteriocin/lantibiotic exporter with double-glycine peptidase domain